MGGRFGELLLILLIILLLFGAGKLPMVMNDIGRSLRALKKGLSSDADNEDKEGK